MTPQKDLFLLFSFVDACCCYTSKSSQCGTFNADALQSVPAIHDERNNPSVVP